MLRRLEQMSLRSQVLCDISKQLKEGRSQQPLNILVMGEIYILNDLSHDELIFCDASLRALLTDSIHSRESNVSQTGELDAQQTGFHHCQITHTRSPPIHRYRKGSGLRREEPGSGMLVLHPNGHIITDQKHGSTQVPNLTTPQSVFVLIKIHEAKSKNS